MVGEKWNKVKEALRDTLAMISGPSKQNQVSIVNFASKAIIEYNRVDPATVPVDSLTFQSGGTNLKNAFSQVYQIFQTENGKFIHCIFMSDGMASYPENEISKIKELQNQKEPNTTFQFNAIVFDFGQKDEELIKKICLNLGGIACQPKNIPISQLKEALFDIIDKK